MYGHVVLAGNLGKDPEKRKTANDDKFVTFSMAVHLEGHQKDATWFDVAVFNERPAKFVAEHVKKGSSVIVSGRLRPNEYDNKDGQKVKTFSVVADEVNFISSGKKKDDDAGDDGGTFGGDATADSGGGSDDW